jgi:hypothetical protein
MKTILILAVLVATLAIPTVVSIPPNPVTPPIERAALGLEIDDPDFYAQPGNSEAGHWIAAFGGFHGERGVKYYAQNYLPGDPI